MIVEFDKSFNKSVVSLKNKSIAQRIVKLIESLELSNSLENTLNTKKLSGFHVYYRIRVGDYRVGVEKINDNTIRLIVVAHRKDIYKLFP